MGYLSIVIYASISLAIGIGPLLIYSYWKYGYNRSIWFSTFLGGLFWFLAFISRIFFLITLNNSGMQLILRIFFAALLAGIFETIFRVFLLYFLKDYTANSAKKLIVTGIGWGLGEALVLHTLPMINLITKAIYQDPDVTNLFNLEPFLLFGGYERILAEIFHIFLIILIFYGIKEKIKTSKSEPLVDNSFTKYPRPDWLWIPIVFILHFLFDFCIVLLSTLVDLLALYIIFTIFIAILYSYIYNRTIYFPLFFKD